MNGSRAIESVKRPTRLAPWKITTQHDLAPSCTSSKRKRENTPRNRRLRSTGVTPAHVVEATSASNISLRVPLQWSRIQCAVDNDASCLPLLVMRGRMEEQNWWFFPSVLERLSKCLFVDRPTLPTQSIPTTKINASLLCPPCLS
jgi:hypothetical protein